MAGNLEVALVIKAIDQATAPLRQVAASLREAAASASKAFQVAANLKQAAEGATAFGNKIKGVLGPMDDIADNFEAEMARVRMYTRASSAEMDALTQSVIGVGSKIGEAAPVDVARAMGVMAKAGYSNQQILAAMPSVLQLSRVAQADLGETAYATARTLKAFGLSADQASQVGDVLAATTAHSQVSVGALGEVLRTVGPLAKQTGTSLGATATVAALLAESGVDAGTSTATLRKAMVNLGGGASGKAKAVLDYLKIKPSKDIVETLRQVKAGIEGLPEENRTKALSFLFGAEAITGATALMENLDSAKLEELSAAIAGSTGELKRQGDVLTTSKTLSAALASQWSQLNITLGAVLGPAMDSATELMISVAKAIKGWAAEHPALTSGALKTAYAVGMIALALGAVLYGISTVVSAFGTAKIAFAGIKTAAVALKSAVVWLFPALGKLAVLIWTTALPALKAAVVSLWAVVAPALAAAAPFIALAAAIGGVALAIRELVKYWDELSFGEVFKGIKETFGEKGAWGTFKDLTDVSGLLGDIGLTTPEIANPQQRVGGEISLKIKSDKPVTVESLKASGPIGLGVDTGLTMAGAG